MDSGILMIKLTSDNGTVKAGVKVENFNMLFAEIEIGRILKNLFKEYPFPESLLIKEICD